MRYSSAVIWFESLFSLLIVVIMVVVMVVALVMRVSYRHRHRVRHNLLAVLVGSNNGHCGLRVAFEGGDVDRPVDGRPSSAVSSLGAGGGGERGNLVGGLEPDTEVWLARLDLHRNHGAVLNVVGDADYLDSQGRR